MAQRDIRRNVFRQIISNELDSDVFSGFASKLLKSGITSFKLDDYNRVLDRLSTELINSVGDLTPRIVSSNFIDTALILSQEDANRISMNLADSANSIDSGTAIFQGPRYRFLFTTFAPAFDHVLNPSNLKPENKNQVYYRGKLEVGTQLYKKDTNDQPISPFYSPTSYYMIESFEQGRDVDLESYLAGADADYLQQVFDDFTQLKNNPLSGFGNPGLMLNIDSQYNDVSAYNNTDFTGGILEVDSDGKVVALYRTEGNYTANDEWFNPPAGTFIEKVFDNTGLLITL